MRAAREPLARRPHPCQSPAVRLALPRRLVVLLAIAALAAVAGAFLPVRDWALRLAGAADALGPAAPLAFLAAYLAAGLLALPLAPLSLAAGLAFGPLGGALLALPCNTLAACAAFLAGRRVGRPVRAGGLALPAGLSDRDGFRLVLLLRLSPASPFSVLNFAFGATRLRLRTFALASLLGSVPVVPAYAALGGLVTRPDAPALRWLGAGGAVLTAIAVTGLARLAARARASRGGTAAPQG
jgi:uncharacterized membrane protein YdjX (TVP38/TMEM64 family)